jgi:hypothetical protein
MTLIQLRRSNGFFLLISLAVLSLGAFGTPLFAQPILHPIPFSLPSTDTTHSAYLPQTDTMMSGAHGALTGTKDGHFQAADGSRLRFFGTEISWTAQFITGEQAHIMAQRLRKLGFNAVRLLYNDYFGWEDASLIKYTDSLRAVYPTTYNPNLANFARLDTLLYEFKKAGIYTVLNLSSYHMWTLADGVPTPDSINTYYYFARFLEPAAANLEHLWAKKLFGHVSPLTGLALGNDPSLAVTEISTEVTPYFYWTLKRLNYIDTNNALNRGLYTVSYLMSKQLDTAYTLFLRNKYANDGALNAAWVGAGQFTTRNLLENGSFEDPSAPAWSFFSGSGAKSSWVDADGGIDSLTYKKVRITQLTTSPSIGDIYVSNYGLSTIASRDSLYEVSFWAKMPYDIKRPGATKRMVALYMYSTPSYGTSLTQSITIDTAWKKYTYTFRCTATGTQLLRLYLGSELGDVWLDAFALRHKSEIGLVGGESMNNYSIVRLQPDVLGAFPLQRTRDQMQFLATLEVKYYSGMYALLRDTLKIKGLVNFSQTNYWINPYDTYKNGLGEMTQGHTGWDYLRSNRNGHYADTAWYIDNNSMTKSTYGGNTGYYIAPAAVEGKPFFMNYSSPSVNQNISELMLLLPAYAAYQDWDGVFVTPYAYRREDIFSDHIQNPFVDATSVNTTAMNSAMMALAPTASKLFREALVKKAGVYEALVHDADDVWLSPIRGYGQYGVEGGLDGNVYTQFEFRQKFDQPTHKIAAEYPYLADTASKHSDTEELIWDQTDGLFTINAPHVNGAAGFFGRDSTVLSGMTFSRVDNGGDLMNLYYVSMDTSALERAAHALLTISTRSQNSGLVWAADGNSFGKSWGTAPMLLSAASVKISLRSNFDSVVIFPLDSMGQRTDEVIIATPDGSPAAHLFTASINQIKYSSVWFDVEKMNRSVVGVEGARADMYSLTLSPNPANQKGAIEIGLAKAEHARVTITDDLGRLVLTLVDGTLHAGSTSLSFASAKLANGHYIVRLETPTRSLTEHLNVVH